MIDWMNICARKKLGKPEWQWCTSERVGDAFLLTGGVPGVYRRGPKKGQPKWPPKSQRDKTIVTQDDRDEAFAEYEKETGQCASCEGSGETPVAWSRERGTTYRPCKRCDGTGLRG